MGKWFTAPPPPGKKLPVRLWMDMICTRMYNSLDRLRNLCQVQNRIKGSENFFLFISLRERFLTTGTSFVLFYFVLPAFLDTGLPRGNRHERDSWDPCKVPSLPNPKPHRPPPGSTTPTLFEQLCGFFYVPHEQISVSAVRRDLRFFVLIRED